MAFPNQNPFGNASFGWQRSPANAAHGPPASHFVPFGNPSATSAPHLFSGSFGASGSQPAASHFGGSLFGRHDVTVSSTTSVESLMGLSTAGAGKSANFTLFGGRTTVSDGGSRQLFGIPSGSNLGSSSLFGGVQTPCGFQTHYSGSQFPSTTSSSCQILRPVFSGQNYFSSSPEFGASSLFGKSRKSEENEPSGQSYFSKTVAGDTDTGYHDAGSRNQASGKTKPPDLMSLPVKKVSDPRGGGGGGGGGGAALLFGKAMASASAERDLGAERRAVRDNSPVKGGSPQRTSTRHVTMSSEVSGDSEAAKRKNLETTADSHEDGGKRKPGLRRSRLASDFDRKVLVVRGIPVRFNNQLRLKNHFLNFGSMAKIILSPKTNSATVYFNSHESAARAKEHGCFLPGIDKPIQLFWRQEPKQRNVLQSSAIEKEETKEVASKDLVSPPMKRPVDVKTGVDEELASMRGTQDVQCDMGQRLIDQPLGTGQLVVQESGLQTRVLSRSPQPPASVKSSGLSASSAPKSLEELIPVVNSATFKSLVGAVGHSAGERYAILDNRDKLLKVAMGNQKQTDIATAKAIRGTCQDMCPEKERYMREDRRRLSSYEIVPGSDLTSKLPPVDHARAVKEYSRSSADQDMPLPEELRPPEVLDMTMNYLLSYIIDTGEAGKWAEWYDFLWNRTRSIRKDITQQHLCNPVAVGLVEKCTRFHIFCSEALCEEDVAIFDPKINNENLTKCLQTLKEMYHDLHVRQNIACLDNEAEFVMYMVLMNLNKGDILREVQQLNAEVRGSPYVNFSIQVYSALNSTNYIKFFKLVQRATFLGACILHRYFNQIRTSALQRMIKAYAQPGHGTTFPVAELMFQLGFETEEEVGNFCRHHGLSVENGQVLLDKNRFCDSEAFTICRSQTLIGGKQTQRLGEIINGGPLPPCIIKEPSSSFDENGRFIFADGGSLVDSKHLVTDVAPANVPSVVIAPASSDLLNQQAVPTQLTVSSEVVKDCARSLILEVINEMCAVIAHATAGSARSLLDIGERLSEELMMAAVGELIKNECQYAVAEYRKELEMEEARHRALISAASEKLSSDLLDEVVVNFLETIAHEEHRFILEMTRKRATEAASDFIAEQLMKQICMDDSEQICHDVFLSDVTERLETLRNCQRAVERLYLGRVFRKWKAEFSAHQRQRKAMETFPPAPSMDSWPDQFSNLVPGSSGVGKDGLHLGGSACITLKPPQEIFMERIRLLNEISYSKAVNRWQHDMSWSPFDLVQMIMDLQLPQKFTSAINASSLGLKFYWKLVVAFPPHVDDWTEEENGMHNWLRAKFSQGTTCPADEEKVKVLSVKSCPLKDSQSVCSYSSVNVCIVSVAGHLVENDEAAEKNHLLGSSGILFVLRHNFENTADFWMEERERLDSLLMAKPPLPEIPVAVLCSSSNSANLVADGLDLEKLKLANKLSNYEVLSLASDVNNPRATDELEHVVTWLMGCCQKPLNLISQRVRDFCEEGLSNKFFTPVLENLKKRREKGLLHLTPIKLILMYNGVVNWMASVASSSKLTQLSWPALEFCADDKDLPDSSWNSENQLQQLHEVISGLVLPEFSHLSENQEVWSEALIDVWNYVQSIVESDKSSSRFLNRVDVLLCQAEHQFKLLCRPSPWSSLDRCPMPLYANFPWMDFIMLCIEYKMDCVLSSDNESDLRVYYLPDAVEPFCDMSVSLEAELETLAEGDVKLLDTVMMAVKRKRMSVKDEAQFPSRKKFSITLLSKRTENSETLAKQQDFVDQLSCAVQVEKKESSDFEDYLKKALDIGALPPTSVSDFFLENNFSVEANICTANGRSSLGCMPSQTTTSTKSDFSNYCQSGVCQVQHKDPQLSVPLCEHLQNLKMLLKSERTANKLLELRLENALLVDFK